MNATRIAILAVVITTAALAQTSGPQPGPALQKLQARHGDWTYEIELFNTPLWSAGKNTGTATSRPTLGGFGAETIFREPSPWGLSESVETNWLDPKSNDVCYVFVSNNGFVEQGTLAMNGGIWTSQGFFMAGGRCWKIRGNGSLSADGNSYTLKCEISPDGGMWVRAFTRTATRAVKPTAAQVAAETAAADESALVALEHAWAKACVNRDVAALDRLAADDWVRTAPDGEVVAKAKDLADIESGDYTASAFTMSDLKVRLYGDTAIVTGRQQEVAKYRGQDASAVSQITDTWHRQKEGWRRAATHLSRVVPPLDKLAVGREVAQVVQHMIGAEEQLDAAAALACHADIPGYLWTDSDGSVHRFSETQKIRTDFLSGCTQIRNTTTREAVEVFDADNALYLWNGTADITTKDGARKHHDARTVCYLVRRIEGSWKIVGGQESATPPPAPPVEIAAAAPAHPAPDLAPSFRTIGFWTSREPATLDQLFAPESPRPEVAKQEVADDAPVAPDRPLEPSADLGDYWAVWSEPDLGLPLALAGPEPTR